MNKKLVLATLEVSIDYCRNCLSKQHFTKKQLEEFK